MIEGKTEHRRRARGIVAVGAGAMALGATIVLPPRPLLVWNATASAPVGLYLVERGAVARGDRVVARMPSQVRALAARRRYLAADVPLVKRVAAVPGDTVCARGRVIWIDGRRAAIRRDRDAAGRALPWWSGCPRLAEGWLLLLTAESAGSFDGRYFGPTRRSDIIGKATLLWRR